MIDVLIDEGLFPDVQNRGRDVTAVEDALHVSVMALSGEVLVSVLVSSRSSVWELKCLIEKSMLWTHMITTHMTLMLGTQVLADAASLHDAGIVEGTMLSIIVAPNYKILVGRGESAELWNHESRLEGTFSGHTSQVTTYFGILPGQHPRRHFLMGLLRETVASRLAGVRSHFQA